MMKRSLSGAVAATLWLAAMPFASADEATDLEQLRNTVINLLEGLVQKGVLTREQAEGMVRDAQEKAAAQAKEKAAKAEAEKDAVRVTYVPETVRKQLSDEVKAELTPQVTNEVIAQAKKDKWGVPGALPSWVNNFSFFGDLRVRAQYDDYAADNSTNTFYDFLTINAKGGIAQAGQAALLNTTEDRLRERIRLRFGFNAKITESVTAGVRLTTGNINDPVSTNQTLGGGSGRYTIAVDQAYLRYDAGVSYNPKFPWLSVWGGRMPNPFITSDLVFDQDLQFDGIAITGRLGVGGRPSNPNHFSLTLGAFPLQEVELSTDDKWLYAGQLGFDWPLLGTPGNEGRIKVAAGYYYFDNITGVRNPTLDSQVTDFTAPAWMQKGNTLFDIRNTLGTNRLFALAAEYHLGRLTASMDLPFGRHKMLFTADYVTNLGYDLNEIIARAGHDPSGRPAITTDGIPRVDGYQMEVGFGSATAQARGDWRAYLGYRYLERDAVVDAYTDSDFHLGGTDTQGYFLRGDWWILDRTALSLRYLTSNEIDGAPFGIDTVMLDITGTF